MNHRVRVLHVITGLSGGGAERSLYNLVTDKGFGEFETEVVCMTSGGVYTERLREKGIRVHVLGTTKGPGLVRAFLALLAVVRRFQPDIVQGWMYHGNLGAWFAQRLGCRTARLSWNVRQSLQDVKAEKGLTRLVILANRKLSGAPDAIIYNSLAARRHHEDYGFAREAGSVIPNGFDTNVIAPSEEMRARVRAEFGFDDTSVVVGHFARFHPMKGHADFINAFNDIAKDDRRIHALLVGRGVTSSNAELSTLVAPQVRDRVTFLGERNDIYGLMNAIDILCLSSTRGEAFPNVLGEAMAMEVPAVATDVGDTARIAGSTSWIVPPSCPRALASALKQAIEIPGEKRREMGKRARSVIVDHFSLPSTVRAYHDIYKSLFADRNGVDGQ